MNITLLDFLQLIPGSLNEILKSFNCSIKKGYFPYKFVNKENLNYIGDKPSKDFFNNISDLDYKKIPNNNWDLKKQTLNYLKSDVGGLLEVLLKFNDNIYSKYKLNISKFKTLPSLALATYRSSYLQDNLKLDLKMIKGELEREIRSSYFGGNVDVFYNKITNGFYYDINSQYPTAMLNDMPVGDPILSLENNLENIFGFVYGEITCPDENSLQVPFIQYKDPFKRITYCPRGKLKRLIFSEEINYALKFGYTIDIEYCYLFNRGKGLFNKYVKDHYEIKTSTTDPIKRSIAKLFLNALYGRMGMKDIDNVLTIMDKKEVAELDKNKNISIISELTDNKYLVGYKGNISDNIRKLYKKDPLKINSNDKKILSKAELLNIGINKKKNTPSAVHIAAAISSYARIIINKYKNIPGNPCIMSDTDSVVLTKPLPDHLIGKGIGQMKLENVITEGIFIRKKLYCIINSNKQVIIKSSGIDSSKLNYSLFLKLLNGESIEIERTEFKVEWKDLKINVVNSNIIVRGLTESIKTLYNTSDINFKFISYPIKYNIIVHPLYPINPIPITSPTENLNTNEKFNWTMRYSVFELITLFIFLFSYFIVIKILFYWKRVNVD